MELSLANITVPDPGPEEVTVRLEAAPLNPSDLGLLFGGADWTSPRIGGSAEKPTVTAAAPLSKASLQAMSARVDVSMPVGNEGAGTVVAAGTSERARALLGRTVAAMGGAMYSQFRTLPIDQCLLLPEGTTAREGASSFINPLTALGMVETMRREGHKALIHTAAASNLGQMLNRLCLNDGVPLINVVRTRAQEELLLEAGAKYVCRSDVATFEKDLCEAAAASGATIAFDAIGGGPLIGQILACMETALSRNAGVYSRYGSTTHKQGYVYGGLNPGPTVLGRNYGMAWGVGGWLVFPYLQRIEAETVQDMKKRIAVEIKTTFASHYSNEISLAEALHPQSIAAYEKRATGQKFLINPSRGHA